MAKALEKIAQTLPQLPEQKERIDISRSFNYCHLDITLTDAEQENLFDEFSNIPKINFVKKFSYLTPTKLNTVRANVLSQLTYTNELNITSDMVESFLYLLEAHTEASSSLAFEILDKVSTSMPGCYDLTQMTSNELASILTLINEPAFNKWLSVYTRNRYGYYEFYTRGEKQIRENMPNLRLRLNNFQEECLAVLALENATVNMWTHEEIRKLFPGTNIKDVILVMYYYIAHYNQQKEIQDRGLTVLQTWTQVR